MRFSLDEIKCLPEVDGQELKIVGWQMFLVITLYRHRKLEFACGALDGHFPGGNPRTWSILTSFPRRQPS